MRQPQLTKLSLSENQIASCANFNGHTRVMILNLSKNKLTKCEGLCHMPGLEELNLSENEIANCEDLKNCPSLRVLNLGTNKVPTLEQLQSFPALQELDVSANQVAAPQSIAHLKQYKKLSKLALAGNPMDETLSGGLKQECLFRLHPYIKLKVVGEDEITEEDIGEWKTQRKERIKAEEEALRLAAEKAANPEPAEAAEEEAE